MSNWIRSVPASNVLYSGETASNTLLRISVGLLARFDDHGRYVLDVLLMGRRGLDALGGIELVVDDRILLWSPLLRRLRLDVVDPALDSLDSLLMVAFVLRVAA